MLGQHLRSELLCRARLGCFAGKSVASLSAVYSWLQRHFLRFAISQQDGCAGVGPFASNDWTVVLYIYNTLALSCAPSYSSSSSGAAVVEACNSDYHALTVRLRSEREIEIAIVLFCILIGRVRDGLISIGISIAFWVAVRF